MKKRTEGWLARDIHSKPAEGRNKGKEAFLTHLEEIKIALETCSIRTTWMMLKDKNMYPGSYSAFWRLVRKYSQKLSSTQKLDPAEPNHAMVKEINLPSGHATPLGNRAAAPPREPARTPQYRQSKTPINSNGEPIE